MKDFSLVQLVSALGLVACTLGAAASADDAAGGHRVVRDLRTTSVQYTAADLATADTVQALYAKLERASRQVCRRDDDRSAAALADARDCRRNSLDAAVALVKEPRLSALHGERCRAAPGLAQVAAAQAAPREH